MTYPTVVTVSGGGVGGVGVSAGGSGGFGGSGGAGGAGVSAAAAATAVVGVGRTCYEVCTPCQFTVGLYFLPQHTTRTTSYEAKAAGSILHSTIQTEVHPLRLNTSWPQDVRMLET